MTETDSRTQPDPTTPHVNGTTRPATATIPFPRPAASPEITDAAPAAPEAGTEGAAGRRVAAGARRAAGIGKSGLQAAGRGAKHPRTRAAAKAGGRFTIRQGMYIVAGGRIVARRTWDARTTARHERMMRAAEAAGDHGAAKEWEQRAEAHKAARHARRMALLGSPILAAKALMYTAAGLFALGIILAITSHHISDVMRPLRDAGQMVRWLMATAAALTHPAEQFGPWAIVAGLWATGRMRGQMPTWLATSTEADELVIDERSITLAIKALGLKLVTAHLKSGLPLQYLTPAREDGRGTYAQVRLPGGTPAIEVVKKRVALASGLHRAAKEVWPTVGSEAGILNLWVADKGTLEQGAGPFPLVTEGTADFFKGVPLGKTLRGTPIVLPLAGRNTIVGGMPDQGKSSAARTAAAGASLDPTCELRIWVPDANFDFEAFKSRCSKYVMGAENEKVRQIRDDLAELFQEVQDRGSLLIKHGEPEVTRKLADKVPGLRPVLCILEEAHVAFNHAEYGKEISHYVTEIVKLCRKRAIHLVVSTQAPTATSIPRDVTRNCTNGLAFAVADHVANDGLLGEGAYRAGHRATELIPGVDKGTCIAKGLSGQRSEAVQVYFVSITRDNDQISPLIKRALAGIEARNAAVLTAPEVDVEQLDTLGDVAEVMRGEDLVGTEEVVHRLKVLRPAAYAEWTTTALAAALRPHGAAPRKAGAARTMHVDLDIIRTAIERRESETDNTEG